MTLEHRISKCNGDVSDPREQPVSPSTIVYDLGYIIVVIQEPKKCATCAYS